MYGVCAWCYLRNICISLPQLLEDDDVHNERVRVMQGQSNSDDIVVIRNMSKVRMFVHSEG